MHWQCCCCCPELQSFKLEQNKILILFMNVASFLTSRHFWRCVIFDAFHFLTFFNFDVFHFWRFSFMTFLLKTLSDVCKGDCKSLNCCERILEIQGICVIVNSAELHHLKKNSLKFYLGSMKDYIENIWRSGRSRCDRQISYSYE